MMVLYHINAVVALFLCSSGCFPHVAAFFQEQESRNWTKTLENVCEVIHNSAPLIDAALDWATGYKRKDGSAAKDWTNSVFDTGPYLEALWTRYYGPKDSDDIKKTLKTVLHRINDFHTSVTVLQKVYKVLSGAERWSPDWRMTVTALCYIISKVEPLKDATRVFVEGNDSCHYKCIDGNRTVPRPGYKQPPPNGCGSPMFGFQFDIGISSMTKCCDLHDRCYGTCGQEKRSCDRELRHCLVNMCSELEPLGLGQSVKVCEWVVTLLHDGVKYLGCRPYQESQREACICQYEDKRDL